MQYRPEWPIKIRPVVRAGNPGREKSKMLSFEITVRTKRWGKVTFKITFHLF
jgi:hypothetical protein